VDVKDGDGITARTLAQTTAKRFISTGILSILEQEDKGDRTGGRRVAYFVEGRTHQSFCNVADARGLSIASLPQDNARRLTGRDIGLGVKLLNCSTVFVMFVSFLLPILFQVPTNL
jgi:hypothetical protein